VVLRVVGGIKREGDNFLKSQVFVDNFFKKWRRYQKGRGDFIG